MGSQNMRNYTVQNNSIRYAPWCPHAVLFTTHQTRPFDCQLYEEESKVLLKCYASSGLAFSMTQELLIPDATIRLAQKAYKYLLDYLRETGSADCL